MTETIATAPSGVPPEAVIFGGGCFWCTEAVFQMLKGIKSVEPGYAGPTYKNDKGPSYEEVSTGTSPYAEVVKIEYNPSELSFEELLHVFFTTHDGTQINRQGNDVGPQYRSVIFYTTERQREKSQHYIDVLNKSTGVQKLVTSVEPLEAFYLAEDYHKNYFARNPGAGYCQLVIEPKVEKVQQKFAKLLK